MVEATVGPEKFRTTETRNGRPLSDAAKRALAEAQERREKHEAQNVTAGELPKEVNGRNGPEPIRYGDWEKNGLISDF